MTMKVYRATSDYYTGAGSCWARRMEDAQEYANHSYFGGDHLICTVVEPTARVLYLDDDDSERFATMLVERAGLDAVRRALDPEALEDDIYRMSADPDWMYPENWIDDKEIREIVASMGYDWVVYIDTYPNECETWVRLQAPVEYQQVS